ncbi:hypothetical protein B0H14DRAFT_2584947, partial [Mycena olivaceomarginata]
MWMLPAGLHSGASLSMEVDLPNRAGRVSRNFHFLAALNVPLSAYSVVQEFTYRPNDTLPAVALSSLVPSMFQQSTVTFTPQLLTVGDIIGLNGSVFNYTVVDIFDGVDQTKPVSSILYYNSLFSGGCDVNVGSPTLPEWAAQYQMRVRIVFIMAVNFLTRAAGYHHLSSPDSLSHGLWTGLALQMGHDNQ